MLHAVRDICSTVAAPPQGAVAMARWEWMVLVGAVCTALGMGLANLGVPSLWHDELVHVYVAKSIAATGWPALPSGNFYPSSTAYNYVLGLFVALLGDSAVAVRLPSVLLGGVNVALVYGLARCWLGRSSAVFAVVLLATSPWHVAWTRQARLYEFQVFSYLLLGYAAWGYFNATGKKALMRFGMLAMLAYIVGILTSFHSILYLGPVGAYAILRCFQDPARRSWYVGAIAACTVLGLVTILGFWLNPNPVDRAAVFDTGLGGTLLDQLRTDRFYYLRFLNNNLSTGFLMVALAGSTLLLYRRDPKGLWVFLAFWVPVLILTFLVGYRRFRFMYFAYPFYIMIVAGGLTGLLALVRTGRRSILHGTCALLVLIFAFRLAQSAIVLTIDSLETASGADISLATRHPQWNVPTAWIKKHRKDEAILTTTFLPVYHYVGHVDNWFPNRYTAWEYQESGMEGLGSLAALKRFLADHPRGYFLAESSRFMMWRWHGALVDVLGEEVTWVEEHMTLIEDASSADVNVWYWNFEKNGTVVIP